MSVLEKRLARELRFDASRFVPLLYRNSRIGWLRPALAERLSGFEKVFLNQGKAVELTAVDLLPGILKVLAEEGFVPGWRDELYRIEDLFDIERAAARPLGLTTYAVHVNGVVPPRGAMWIARRSRTKPVDPGMLDNLVGGGLTAGLTPEQVLVKEAWEEAGIPPQLAQRATREGTVNILREVPEGVQSEVIDVYDLELPEDFTPANQDGEVAEFRLLPFAEAMRKVVETEELTLDAALVARDYFTRARPA